MAAEALAVVTVMPLVARELHGLSLYGYVFSAFMLGTMVGVVAAGRAADRHGPAAPYIAGLLVFCAGLAIAGTAPSMPVLVGGRALQGLGAGAVPAVAYAAIGRTLPDALRARMMAVLSTAWVVPGLAGPALSAEVARAFGWRWVFLGLLPIIALTGPLALPALLRLGRPQHPDPGGHRLIDGVGIAVAAGALLAGLSLAVDGGGGASGLAGGTGSAGGSGAAGGGGSGAGGSGAAGGTGGTGGATASGLSVPDVVIGCVLIVAGAVLLVVVLRRLLPSGTLAARPGLPATILMRSLLTFTFFGADAFVTLAITIVKHRSPLVAGVAITGATLAWTAGAWIQARMNTRWPGRRLIRIGLSIILAGIVGLAVMLTSFGSVAGGIAAWTVAGLGMGIAYAPITLLMLGQAPAGREGWASASLNLADVLGSALGIGIGGVAVGAAVRLNWPVAAGVAIECAIATAIGITALTISRKLPATKSDPEMTTAT